MTEPHYDIDNPADIQKNVPPELIEVGFDESMDGGKSDI